MGLIKDGNRFAVLTDILGDEDHLGDMDFRSRHDKRHRAADGHQDRGITKEIMQVALAQARARLHLKMQEAMRGARPRSRSSPRPTR